jgi:hypothetical protein
MRLTAVDALDFQPDTRIRMVAAAEDWREGLPGYRESGTGLVVGDE